MSIPFPFFSYSSIQPPVGHKAVDASSVSAEVQNYRREFHTWERKILCFNALCHWFNPWNRFYCRKKNQVKHRTSHSIMYVWPTILGDFIYLLAISNRMHRDHLHMDSATLLRTNHLCWKGVDSLPSFPCEHLWG